MARLSYCLLFGLALLFGGLAVRGGATSYTDRGKIDFDTALQLLNPYGTWSKIGGAWGYTPLDHGAPYTDGRWLYTEYGWYWQGARPHSWATEHYGYWKRNGDASATWVWYPGPYWLPQIVEIRATSSHIGWRTGAVNRDGNFVETAADRYSKTDEWTFVTLAQFANPITPGILAKPDVAKAQLEDSTDCRHTYLTYREIDRPGPHPADFADLCKDGKMLAPKTAPDELAIQAPAPRTAVSDTNKTSGTNSPAAAMTGTNQPVLMGADVDPSADTRKVRYWITMSLPTAWTPPPVDAKPQELYLYRPDFYQDEDGIGRRITLWFDPKSRTTLKEILGESLPGAKSDGPARPATAATPAQPANGKDPFRSPLDDSYHPAATSAAANQSTKTAPSGAKVDAAPIPSPLTNSAPTPAR